MPQGRGEIRVRNVNKNIVQQIDNIAANMGITRNDLMKTELPKIIQNYPERYRLSPPDGD